MSLADELSGSQLSLNQPTFSTLKQPNSLLAYKCSYLLDEDSSPDSDKMQTSMGDVDSGHSTAHSPNDYKSITPPPNARSISPNSHSPFPPAFGGVPFSQLEMLEGK